jgi:hypothetical protein
VLLPEPQEDAAEQTMTPTQDDAEAASAKSTSTADALIQRIRECAQSGPMRGVGVHGSPLVYQRVMIDSPAQARARGERGGFASLSDEYRLVSIPESPPFDARVPNGVVLRLDLKSGTCTPLPMR